MTFHISAIFLPDGEAEPETLCTAETMQRAVELGKQLGETYHAPDYRVRIITPWRSGPRERAAIRVALVLLGVAGEVI